VIPSETRNVLYSGIGIPEEKKIPTNAPDAAANAAGRGSDGKSRALTSRPHRRTTREARKI
jgi:hypothetical protein